jgi:uncharacterized protein
MSPQYLSPGVYVEEVDRGSKPIEGVGTAVAGFIGFAAKGPVNKPTFVANWTQFMGAFGGFLPGAYLAHAVFGYFNNGGGSCYVMGLPWGDNGEGAAKPMASLLSKAAGAPPTLRAAAREEGAGGEDISVEVSDAGDDKFNFTVRRGSTEEKFEGLSMSAAKGAQNAVETVNKQSKLILLEEVKVAGSVAERAPALGVYALASTERKALTVKQVAPDMYQGSVAARSGLGGFEAIDDITMIAAPDLMAAYQAGAMTREQVKAVQLAMIAHCENMKDRVAILDPLPDLNAQEVKDWRMKEAGYDSKYAALYYPWIQVANPAPGANGATLNLPPSGHVAGIWARNDTERGVHKAPANEVVRGVISLALDVTKSEQDSLNPEGVNCIRAFPGRGIRVWGARTLSSDPSWRYINVRRLFNFVEESIQLGTQWVVFEPNDLDLWQRVKRTITAFLTRVWRDGALFGATPQDAFYVKCDAENNPPETRDAGQLIIEIGIAPVKPAEFVIFRISQYSGGGSVAE